MEQIVEKKISQIIFGVMSPKQIKDNAFAKVVTPELYDKEGYPVDGGLMDVRLGVIDPGLRCKTCGQKLKECPGHFGYVELARPIVHIKFASLILDILRTTCNTCSRTLIPDEKRSSYTKELEVISKEGSLTDRRDRIKEIVAELRTINKCPHCEAKQEKITIDKPTTFLEGERRLSPIELRSRFEKIPDKDLRLYGIDASNFRPEWSILTILPIPPVTMRPSITLESGERSEDDLTHKLGDIVRINQRLFENINAGSPEIVIEDLWDLLQYHITTFFDNEVSQLPPARHRSGQPLKTITSRIKSKEGRIRHNLAGKRTNFSARTVISPDPMLDINEVGVPSVIAMKLTVPERVTSWNADYLKKFIENGPKKYPGANYLIRPDGKRKKITDETREQLLEELQPGFIVERHLMDGDISVFNRQPSLHRMSMMSHKVRVLPGLTFRLNPAVIAPYNADFDGDEMNLHIPQTEEARIEAEQLMEVETQLISPRYGLSIIACRQDSISGNFLLTREGFSLTRNEAIDLLAAANIYDFDRLPKKETVTGKEIFSVLLPKDFNYRGFSKRYSKDPKDPDALVHIKNGLLVSGVMDANNLGEGSGLLLRTIHKQYGKDVIVGILSKMNMLGNEVLMHYGLTFSISNLDLLGDGKKLVEQTIKKAEVEVVNIINKFKAGTLEVQPGRSERETLELTILEVLNRARNDCGRIVEDTARQDSSLMHMVRSGAKGNVIQLAQMAALTGQQAFRGGRISKGYARRTLSCFRKDDLGSSARGFVANNFHKGLAPHELFFMAMTGRDSLMDTALRTPKSGYLYRRLANALQDLVVRGDQSVREASGKIVQFSYGEDGVDVAKSEAGRINIKRVVDAVLEG
ncbi:MAG: DNA-directed RNA polymerase subunit A' [Candidatus Woesearchaeota archaeon]|nr:MAG: DNA-directed RNA polymerase subunit A' [Candidatus Woesearchaeota archaeon]